MFCVIPLLPPPRPTSRRSLRQPHHPCACWPPSPQGTAAGSCPPLAREHCDTRETERAIGPSTHGVENPTQPLGERRSRAPERHHKATFLSHRQPRARQSAVHAHVHWLHRKLPRLGQAPIPVPHSPALAQDRVFIHVDRVHVLGAGHHIHGLIVASDRTPRSSMFHERPMFIGGWGMTQETWGNARPGGKRTRPGLQRN